ncbi:MAG: hypothetical protein AAF958_17710 [Planctomycetota bacterium]
MIRRIRDAALAALVLALAFLIYRSTLGVWLRPPQADAVPLKPFVASRPVENIGDLFEQGQWQSESCMRIQTLGEMLLFKKWEPLGQNGWKLKPVTIVIGRGLEPSGDQDPIILESEEGAEITFTDPLDVTSGKAPAIEKGRLIGDVTMRRRGDQPLAMQTRNVGINRKRIWTTEPLSMRMGRAEIAGRDLTLHLIESEVDGKRTIRPERMELIYLDRCRLPLDSGSGFSGLGNSDSSHSDSGNAQAPSDSLAQRPARVEIACGGRVEYGFLDHTLRMDNGIRIEGHNHGGSVDQFRCDEIELVLRRPTDSSLPRRDATDWIERMEATGQPLAAMLPSRNMRVQAGRLRWDVTAGWFSAEGPQGIAIQRGDLSARMASIHYQFDRQFPKRFGRLICRGAAVVDVADASSPIRLARFNDKIEVVALNDSETSPSAIQVSRSAGQVSRSAGQVSRSAGKSARPTLQVDVVGGLDLVLDDGGTAHAGAIRGYLKPDPHDASGYQPDRFDVSQDVRVDSSRLDLVTESLKVYWTDRPPHALEAARLKGQGSDTRSTRDAVARLQQPGAGDGQSDRGLGQFAGVKTEAVTKPTRELPKPIIQGDRVGAELHWSPGGWVPRQMYVDGNVRVETTTQVGDQSMQAELTGHRLQMIQRAPRVDDPHGTTSAAGSESATANAAGPPGDILQLLGSDTRAAKLAIGDGFFAGPAIQVYPGRNRIEMNSAGEFKIPTGVLPQQANSGIAWTRSPHCRWRGKMTFDGRQIRLDGGVDIDAGFFQDATPWSVKLGGESLTLELDAPVQIRDTQSLRSAVPSQMVLRGSPQRPVVADARSKPLDGQHTRHRFHAETLTLLPPREQRAAMLFGKGQGWYRGWFRGKDKSAGDASRGRRYGPEGRVETAGADKRDTDPVIHAVHLVYRDVMRGDLTLGQLMFGDGVRLGIAPVETFDQSFDVDAYTSPSMGMSILDCRTLRIGMETGAMAGEASRDSAAGGQRGAAGGDRELPPLEVVAEGPIRYQTRVASGLFRGTASRALYASRADLFTVTSQPGRPASFEQWTHDGDLIQQGTLKLLEVHPQAATVDMVPLSLTQAMSGQK